MAIRVRLATEADASALTRLNWQFNQIGLTVEQMAENLRRAAPAEQALLAEVDGQAIGFACLRVEHTVCYPTPYAELTELYVAENDRGQGAGSALVGAALTMAAQAGALDVYLATDFENEAAQRLYRRHGFLRDSLRMRAPLGALPHPAIE